MYSANRDEVLLHVVVGFVMEDFDTKEKAFPDVVRATNQMATATALHRDIILVVVLSVLFSSISNPLLLSTRCPQQAAELFYLANEEKMPNALIKGGII